MPKDNKLVAKEAPNIVHQNAIWRETIRKETRSQKLYTAYHINPHKKIHNLTGKSQNIQCDRLLFKKSLVSFVESGDNTHLHRLTPNYFSAIDDEF